MNNKEYFKTRYSADPRRQIVWREIAHFLKPHIGEKSAVVDVGCGYGDFVKNLEWVRGVKTAIDIYDADEKRLRDFAAAGVNYLRCDCCDMSILAGGSYDVCFSSNLLEHLERNKIPVALSEMRRILKAGGTLILILPNYRYCYKIFWDDYTHITPLTDRSINDLLSASGFKIKKIIPAFIPFSFKESGLPIYPVLVRWYIHSPLKPFAAQLLAIAHRE